MRYLPHTGEDVAEMLEVIGVARIDDLFASIPENCRRSRELQLPEPLTEWELGDHLAALADKIAVRPEYKIFVGAGSYEHYIPEAVSYLIGRSEFTTAYTPYQPEVSQGTLQAVYEYQTLVSRLLRMEVANASLYDGASALAESVLMAIRITRQRKVAVARLVHPSYRKVLKTYLRPSDHHLLELPYLQDGRTDLSALDEVKDLAAVVLQSPNFFGCIEDLQRAADKTHEKGALFICAFSEPLAYGLFKPPGSLGADIVCGEGQSFGVPRSFGGPSLGIFATKMQYVRSMPGRLVGATADARGRRGYVLTLATREQHIRREKATSNICTNNTLCAIRAAIYLACLGATGIRELALLNRDKTEYLKKELVAAGSQLRFPSPTFNEFVVKFPQRSPAAYEQMLEKKIMGGLPLAPYYPELTDHYLLCVTEVVSKADMDALVKEITS